VFLATRTFCGHGYKNIVLADIILFEMCDFEKYVLQSFHYFIICLFITGEIDLPDL